jgi:hypothetical protein
MTTKDVPSMDTHRAADKITVISCTEVGPHTYKVVTKSDKYGMVTQTILSLPEGTATRERMARLPKK